MDGDGAVGPGPERNMEWGGAGIGDGAGRSAAGFTAAHGTGWLRRIAGREDSPRCVGGETRYVGGETRYMGGETLVPWAT